jgi:brefeldin A-inhibited guanine nucleotide-exchange protein
MDGTSDHPISVSPPTDPHGHGDGPTNSIPGPHTNGHTVDSASSSTDFQDRNGLEDVPLGTPDELEVENSDPVHPDHLPPTVEPGVAADESIPQHDVLEIQSPSARPPTPPAKMVEQRLSDGDSRRLPPTPVEKTGPHSNGHREYPETPNLNPSAPVSTSHRRSLTTSQGRNVSVVLISSALETILASKEAKRSVPFRESAQQALEMVRAGQGGDRPREIFEPLRLACETRNEKLMIASLDCISKLISYSFFVEDLPPSEAFPSPPASPGPNAHPPSLVDLVVHTITACHTETTMETVSLQIVKALLSLVLSPTILVHHSSLLKAVRTVYNVFLLSTDPVNQMVAQGGLTQMVHHVFTRCQIDAPPSGSMEAPPSSQGSVSSSNRPSLTISRSESVSISPLTPPSARHASLTPEVGHSESTTANNSLAGFGNPANASIHGESQVNSHL